MNFEEGSAEEEKEVKATWSPSRRPSSRTAGWRKIGTLVRKIGWSNQSSPLPFSYPFCPYSRQIVGSDCVSKKREAGAGLVWFIGSKFTLSMSNINCLSQFSKIVWRGNFVGDIKKSGAAGVL